MRAALRRGSTPAATRAERSEQGGGCARKSDAQQQKQAARPRPRPAPCAEEGRPTRRQSKPTATHSDSVSTGRGDHRRAARGTARGEQKGDHAGGSHSSTCATQGPKKGTGANPPTKPSGAPPPRAKPQDSDAPWAPHPTWMSLWTRIGVPQAHAMAVGVREKTDNGTATRKETQPATECCPQRGPPPLPLRPHAPLTSPPWPPAPRTRAACVTVSRPAAPSAPPPP